VISAPSKGGLTREYFRRGLGTNRFRSALPPSTSAGGGQAGISPPSPIHLLQPAPPHPRSGLRRGGCRAKIRLPIVAPRGLGNSRILSSSSFSTVRGERTVPHLHSPRSVQPSCRRPTTVDLGGFGPVLAYLEGGGYSFLAVEPGEGLPAEALEAAAEVGVQVRTDEVLEGRAGAHVADEAGAGEDEMEPEAEQRVRQVVVDGAGRGGLAGQGSADR
jgi:hypothetical protein